MKVIAFYLPQFHATPENDEWWGKGFTEWTNTKKAKPLYYKRYQPREPLNDNFYDLTDNSVMREQMKMAKKYGVGGFCFYHYWFSGKKLLEKPIENLLFDKASDLPFCLSWANEPWTRTWDGDLGSKKILIAQEYGNENEWKEHFNYLLQFFKDSRYICIEGKPVFLIYRAENIPRCKEMLNYWNELAISNGLFGIYFIKTLTAFAESKKDMGFAAQADFEPLRTMNEYNAKYTKSKSIILDFLREKPLLWKLALPVVDYDKFYKLLIKRKNKTKLKRFYGVFTDWDNTARKGKHPLLIFKNGSPQKFTKYLKIQLNRSIEEENELLFINAWNEWAEGAYLEPDKKYGFAYLKAVSKAVNELKKGRKSHDKKVWNSESTRFGFIRSSSRRNY